MSSQGQPTHWPETDWRAPHLVAGIVDTRHEAVFKVFLPLFGERDMRSSWADVSRNANAFFSPECHWSDIEGDLADSDCEWMPAHGRVDNAVIEELIKVVSPDGFRGEVWAVFWLVYNEPYVRSLDSQVLTANPLLARSVWHDGSHAVVKIHLDDVRMHSRESWRRFPVAVFPEDLSWNIAMAGYGNELYVSGDSRLKQRLMHSSLEWQLADPRWRLEQEL